MFNKILSDFENYFKDLDNSSSFILNVGAELEFYYDSELILNKQHGKIKQIENILSKENLIHELTEEDGENQFEVNFNVEKDPKILVEKINRVKEILLQNNCILSAKPKKDSPSSAMHFNISLFVDDINLFQKNPKTGKYMIFLYQAIGGMLHFLEESMYIFAPMEECYKRFKAPTENEIFIHYPTNCSWGFNNRTVAIRVPTILNKIYKESRIEHRVCSSMADAEKSLFLILYSIYYGITNFIQPIEPVFGNAFSHEYEHLTPFPFSLDKARKIFEKGRIKGILEQNLTFIK